jgi:hypothetical protein
MANKEAVFTLRVNTGNSVKDVQSFDAAVQNLNKDIQEVQQTASNGTGLDSFDARLKDLNAKVEAGGLTMRQMTQVMKEYQNIAAQAGMESPIGQQAIQSASQLKDTIGDLKAATTALSSDFVGLDTALAGVETGAAVFQGFESAVALTGVESEALMQTMVKLQAVQGLVNAATTVANKLNDDAVLGIKLRSFYEKAYSTVVGESTGALKNLKLAMAATGVGALIAGIIALISNFQSLTDAIGLTSDSQRALDASMDAYAKGAEEATQKTSEMEAQFALAEKGVISKEEALRFYNDTLGDTLGSADDLNEAEQLYLDKKDAFIQATAERAQAQELFSLAAKESAEAFKQKLEVEQNAGLDYFSNLLGTAADVGEYIATGDENFNRSAKVRQAVNDELTANIEEGSSKRIAAYQKEGQRLLESATAREKNAGIASQSETAITLAKEKSEKAEKAAEEARKKREKAAEERRKKAEKAAEEAKRAAEEAAKIERDRLANLLKIQQEYLVQIQEAESAYQDSLLSAQEQETNVVLDKYFVLIKRAKEYGQDTKVLEQARTAELLAITKKYNDEAIAAQLETDQTKKDLLQNYQDIVSDDLDQQVLDLERSQEDQSKKLAEALAANVITQEEYNSAQLVLENEYTAKLKEVEDARTQLVKDEEKKRFDARIASAEQAIEISQQVLNSLSAINDAVNAAQENQIAEAQAQAEEQKSIYDKQQADELANTALTEQQRKAIEDKYNKLKYQADLKAFQEEDKLKKQQFDRDKAFKIAQIAIDTATAITKAIATYGPPPSPLGIFGIATAGAIGIAQAAAVASTQYKSGTPPSLGSAEGGGSMTGAGASTFTSANTNTQQTNLSDILGQGGTGQGTVSKVYVLESDITDTQNKVATQEKLSTY